MTDLLIKMKAMSSINQQDRDGRSALLVAAQCRQYKVCEYLLKEGADINLCDNDNISPLYHLCADGDIENLERFISEGADVNAEGCLQVALDLNHINIAEELLKHNVNVNKV